MPPIRFSFTRSRQILLYLSAFCLGTLIGAEVGFGRPGVLLTEALAALLLLGLVFWSARPVRILSFMLVAGIGGFVWAGFYRQAATQNLPEQAQSLTIEGKVISDPEEGLTDRRAVLKITAPEEIVGQRVWLEVGKAASFRFGDRLKTQGKLGRPQKFAESSFDYPNYLLARRRAALVFKGKQAEVLQTRSSHSVLGGIFEVKNKFKESLAAAVKEPEAGFLLGLIIGGQPDIAPKLKDDFVRTGTSHIMAVSGYNLAIIAVVIFRMLRRVSFRSAVGVSSLLAILFVIATGAEPSVVRAGVLTGFYLLGKVLGRPTTGIVLLFWTAALMLLFNPLALRFDPSFILSFLAVLGLFYVAPVFEKRLAKTRVFEALLPELREALVASLAATVATLPFIVIAFGRVSLVAPVVNLLVVPLVPILMLLGFVTGAVGLVWGGLAKGVGLVSFGLARLALAIIGWFADLGWASLTLSFRAGWLLIASLLLVFTLGWARLKIKARDGSRFGRDESLENIYTL